MTDYQHPDFQDPALQTLYCHECGELTRVGLLDSEGRCEECGTDEYRANHNLPFGHTGPCEECAPDRSIVEADLEHALSVRELEAEGLTTSDAQSVADAEGKYLPGCIYRRGHRGEYECRTQADLVEPAR